MRGEKNTNKKKKRNKQKEKKKRIKERKKRNVKECASMLPQLSRWTIDEKVRYK